MNGQKLGCLRNQANSQMGWVIMNPEIQELRDRLNRRAAFRQSIKDFALFVILPLIVGFIIEGLLK